MLGDLPPQYREHARRSRALADAAESEAERELFRDMAAHWDALADAFDRLRRRDHRKID